MSTLYISSIPFSQTQAGLLHPNIVSVTDGEQIEAIESCLASCTAAFDMVNTEMKIPVLPRLSTRFTGKDGDQ